MVYPCLHVLFASLSDSSELMKSGGFLLYPKGFTLDAYLEVFKNQLIWSGYGNTILNLVLALAFNISLTTLGAYALSRKELMVRRPIMLMIIFTMFFSGRSDSQLYFGSQLGYGRYPLGIVHPHRHQCL